ncbi:hypothetical protein UVI_02047160 [Ustilaginoidea virens]|uniref:Uncharacterized protein n=1 Tax=Ustilaginoidea virens TaxID=1159556 RepID=A0A1B5L5C7_USTVR|nr:hypothetical protein UVI_02047160 [Ustilaginoidea virens]
MEDQFGGRTDDDLFYDDFEPVESETADVPRPQHTAESASVADPEPIPAKQPPQQSQPASKNPPPPGQASASAANTPSSPAPSQPRAKGAANTLSSSRFARKARNASKKPGSTPPPPAATRSPSLPKQGQQKQSQCREEPAPGDKSSPPPPNAPTAPARDKKPPASSSSAAAATDPEARLQSGANPRQKLTDAELAAKMEQMKLLAAEKTRKFEEAEKDERQHAEAYAKGMEEARRRKADDAERRRRGEENKRKLDEERAKNRERKLKAMGAKEAGWDEGKEAVLEAEARRGFRGANGGVRGTKRGGLGDSRYAREGQEQPDVDRFLDDRYRRGRGGRGRGRGRDNRRGGFEGGPDKPADNSAAPALTSDQFPALPSDGKKKSSDSAIVPVYPPQRAESALTASLSTPSPLGGKWDDEMEALDELKRQGKS